MAVSSSTARNKMKLLHYNTSLKELGSGYQIDWIVENFDIIHRCFKVIDFDPNTVPIEYATTKEFSWGMHIILPNAILPDESLLTKSNQIGYIITIKNVSKELPRNLAGRVHFSIFDLDSGEEKLLCSDKFCQKRIVYAENDTDIQFMPRIATFTGTKHEVKLLIRMKINLYINDVSERIQVGREKFYCDADKVHIQNEIEKTNHEIGTELKYFRKYFPDFFIDREFDFKIVAKNETFDFHVDLLKARGGAIFKAMLETSMRESQNNEAEIKCFDSAIIDGFRSYLYDGTVPNIALSPEEFYKFGHMFGLDDIKRLSELTMRSTISRETFNDYRDLTIVYPEELKSLEADLRAFLCNPAIVKDLVKNNYENITLF